MGCTCKDAVSSGGQTGDIKQAFLQVRIKKEERDSLRFHVDDLLSGKPTVAEVKELKVGAIQIFANGILMLLSWKVNNLVWKQRIPLPNSNLVHQLIKSPVCLASPGIRKLMRSVSFPEMRMPVTKRELLHNLASIYDPLGLVVTLKEKIIY